MILSGVFLYELTQLVPYVHAEAKHADEEHRQHHGEVSDCNHRAILGSGKGTLLTAWQLPSSLAKDFFTKSLSI